LGGNIDSERKQFPGESKKLFEGGNKFLGGGNIDSGRKQTVTWGKETVGQKRK
jgi:hypothetical protein